MIFYFTILLDSFSKQKNCSDAKEITVQSGVEMAVIYKEKDVWTLFFCGVDQS